MNFKVEKKDTYAIIEMDANRLDVSSAPELRSELVLLSGSGVNKMILDMSKCSGCDTAGLSAILIANRLCKDGMLVLSGVQSNVENILSLQRFDPALILVPTIVEAEARISKSAAE